MGIKTYPRKYKKHIKEPESSEIGLYKDLVYDIKETQVNEKR